MGKGRSFKVVLSNLPCSCGGTLRPHRLGGIEYDASAELGIPTLITGSWMVLKCDRCGEIALPGAMLEALSAEAVLLLLGLDRRVSGTEAKFLRKAALGVGQEELGNRLGVSRPTVARWEAEASLSPEHDLQLRNYVLLHLLRTAQFRSEWKKGRPKLLQLVKARVIEEARSTKAPRVIPPLRLAA